MGCRALNSPDFRYVWCTSASKCDEHRGRFEAAKQNERRKKNGSNTNTQWFSQPLASGRLKPIFLCPAAHICNRLCICSTYVRQKALVTHISRRMCTVYRGLGTKTLKIHMLTSYARLVLAFSPYPYADISTIIVRHPSSIRHQRMSARARERKRSHFDWTNFSWFVHRKRVYFARFGRLEAPSPYAAIFLSIVTWLQSSVEIVCLDNFSSGACVRARVSWKCLKYYPFDCSMASLITALRKNPFNCSTDFPVAGHAQSRTIALVPFSGCKQHRIYTTI